MLEPDVIRAATLAAAGEVQGLMNHLGLAARSAHTAKAVFESDLRASLRRALQFGRAEMVTVDSALGASGVLAEPTDVVVAARTKIPQLAVELRLHPRGEDHAGFAGAVVGDILKMALARTRQAVEQAAVLVGAPGRFWRWLPGYVEDRDGFELLSAEAETPANTKAEFLADRAWDFLFDNGMDVELPDRIWTSLFGSADVRSPWMDLELRLLEVKGLGALRAAR